MEPSHLAALVMAGLGIGGMSHAAFSSPIPLHQQQQRSDINKKNQRQTRLARRRKHAAGHKKAFC